MTLTLTRWHWYTNLTCILLSVPAHLTCILQDVRSHRKWTFWVKAKVKALQTDRQPECTTTQHSEMAKVIPGNFWQFKQCVWESMAVVITMHWYLQDFSSYGAWSTPKWWKTGTCRWLTDSCPNAFTLATLPSNIFTVTCDISHYLVAHLLVPVVLALLVTHPLLLIRCWGKAKHHNVVYRVGQKSKLLYSGLQLRQLWTNLKKFHS